MDLIIPETNKKQFNELAETIINELAKVFPMGIELFDHLYSKHGDLLRPTIIYLLHTGYLHNFKDEGIYTLTEKSVENLDRRTGFKPIID